MYSVVSHKSHLSKTIPSGFSNNPDATFIKIMWHVAIFSSSLPLPTTLPGKDSTPDAPDFHQLSHIDGLLMVTWRWARTCQHLMEDLAEGCNVVAITFNCYRKINYLAVYTTRTAVHSDDAPRGVNHRAPRVSYNGIIMFPLPLLHTRDCIRRTW